jgi:hypothetical protein
MMAVTLFFHFKVLTFTMDYRRLAGGKKEAVRKVTAS